MYKVKKRKFRSFIEEKVRDAVKEGKLDNVRKFIERDGAEVNVIDRENYDKKLIHIAAQAGHRNMVEFFISKGVSINETDKRNWTPLHYATLGGQLETVQFLVSKKANIEVGSIDGKKLLHIAALEGHKNVMEFLLDNGSNINDTDVNNLTPLYYAVSKGHLEVVRFLSDKGAPVNAEFTVGYKPIHCAAKYGHESVIEFLLSKGVNVDDTDRDNRTPLHYATWKNQVKAMQFLIDKEANINAECNPYGAKSIHIAAIHGYESVLKFLISKSVNVNDTDKSGWTPLHWAAGCNQLGVIKFLVNENANVNAETFNTWKKPVHIAAQFGHKDVVEFFLKKGLSVDEMNKNGYTLLHFAALKGHLEVVQFLVDKKAKINTECITGRKPIHSAAEGCYQNIVEFFLSKGLNVDERSKTKWASLHYVSQKGHLELVRFLLKKGADATNKNLNMVAKPLNIAAYNGHRNVVQLFLQFGLDPNAYDYNGNTPFHFAAGGGHLSVIECLVEYKAHMNIENIKGEKPIHIAARNNQKSVIEYLVKHNVNIRTKTRSGASPLHIAAMYRPINQHFWFQTNKNKLFEENYKNVCRNQEVLDFLILNNGGINELDKAGKVPLCYAVAETSGTNVSYIVKKLIDAGARIDIQDNEGMTPLHHAVTERNLVAVKKMVKTNTNLDIQDNDGNSPLLLASIMHDMKIMMYLLRAGANSDIKDNDGRTILYHYIYYYRHTVAKNKKVAHYAPQILEKVSNYTDIDFMEKKTALHLAIKCDCDRELVELILRYQKELNTEDLYGNTAINFLTEEWSIARGGVCVELIKLLVENGAHLKVIDCHRIIGNSLLRDSLFRDVTFCTQAVVNRFNDKELPALYSLTSVPLLSIERMRLKDGQKKFIEHAVKAEIESNGYCNPIGMSPTLLTRSYICHYLKNFPRI